MPRAGWKKPESDRRLSDLVSVGVLTRVFPPDVVDEVIEAAGRTQQRHRALPARVIERPCSLAMAQRNGAITPGITIFHSDRGCQYTSAEFAEYTDTLGVVRSLGRTGTCYDNAWAESFNSTLKVERVHRTAYPTREHARLDVSRYIELRYNQIRLHSALGYMTLNEVEREWLEQNPAA